MKTMVVVCVLMILFIYIDGAYEKQMSICPPPLTMVVFSLVEIVMFLIDVIHFQ